MKKQAEKRANKKEQPINKGLYGYYALIAGLVLVLYINSFNNGYAIDDNIVTNKYELAKKGFAALPEIFTTNYVTGTQNFEYRPLVKATYAIEHQFFGTNPKASHVINALLYLLTGIVLFNFLRRCFNKQNLWIPLLTTLLFIAHPVHTEVVDNLKSRDELLSLLFGLLAATSLLHYAEQGKTKHLLAGLGLFIVALISKASCIAFVGIIPLAIYFFRGKKKEAIISGISLGALTGLFYIILSATLPAVGRETLFIENPLVESPNFGTTLASAFYWLSHYVRLLIVPYPMAFYYGYNQLPVTTFANPLAVLSLLLHLFLLGYAVYSLKNRNPLGFAVWIYLGGIAMFANIIVPVVGIVGERFLYLASLGFCMAVAIGILRLAKLSSDIKAPLKGNITLYAACGVLLLPYSVITINRNTHWKDALTLFRHDIKVVKNSAKAHGELALELRRQFKALPSKNANRQKLAAEAATHFAASLKIYPNSSYANYLGTIYLFEERNPTKALLPLQNAVKISKNPPIKYYLDLANCYQALRTLDSSEKYFLKVLDMDTMHIQAHYQLAKNAYLQGDTATAKNINRRFLSLHPTNPLPYRNQGDFYVIEGDTAKAVDWYKKEKYYQDRMPTTPTKDDE